MKVIVEFEIEVDGRDLSTEEITEAVSKKLGVMATIISEEIDGTDEWAILIDSYTVEVETERG